MKKIINVSLNKSFKLSNVLISSFDQFDISRCMSIYLQMENYIKSKGATVIGPKIQMIESIFDTNQEFNTRISFMIQSDSFFEKTDDFFQMKKEIYVCNCMYARYTGPEEKLKLAYDKINVTAFEEDIELSNTTYTIFVDKQDDNIVADIFVEKKTDE